MAEKISSWYGQIKSKPAVIIFAILIIGGSYYGYKKTHPAVPAVQYVTAVAEKGMFTTSVSASGNIIVDQSASVDPDINGIVANLSVDVGDRVTEGQFLFDIINDDLSVSVEKSRASYESAKNSLESAKIDEDTAKSNYENALNDDEEDDDAYTREEKEILKDKIDLAENKVTQAEKSLASSLADYKNVQTDAAKRKVTSPIAGTVNAIGIKNGDDLSKLSSGSSRQVPMIVGDLSTLKAQVQVNEVDISNVQIGQKVTFTFDALTEFTATGQVEKMDSLGTITQGVVTYNVTIGLDSLDSRIKPDMSVTAAIITSLKQGAIIIPASAVKTQSGNSYVEVLNGSTPERIPVEVGASNNTSTEIISGIKAGDKVVTQTVSSGTAATSTSASTSSSQNRSGGSGARIPGLGGFGR